MDSDTLSIRERQFSLVSLYCFRRWRSLRHSPFSIFVVIRFFIQQTFRLRQILVFESHPLSFWPCSCIFMSTTLVSCSTLIARVPVLFVLQILGFLEAIGRRSPANIVIQSRATDTEIHCFKASNITTRPIRDEGKCFQSEEMIYDPTDGMSRPGERR
jgi:hypothetical protein